MLDKMDYNDSHENREYFFSFKIRLTIKAWCRRITISLKEVNILEETKDFVDKKIQAC